MFALYPASAAASAPLFYHAYATGCEPGDEPHLELVHGLISFYDAQYAPALVVLALRDTNPEVQRLAVVEPDGTVRRDWPWLSDDALDALESRCRHYLGAAVPTHGTELKQLLHDLQFVAEPLSAHQWRAVA